MSETSPIFVLGMHRSGTSCLAGLLEEAGLYLGDVKHESTYNVKGNRENPLVMKLNERVLMQNGASWDSPPPHPVKWNLDAQHERDRVLATYRSKSAWGIKDPRLLFTLDGWLSDIPRARIVATFRHPVAVARSLRRRNRFTAEHSLSLWRKYNTRLLDLAKRFEVSPVSFDLDMRRYLASVEGIAISLGLQPPRDGWKFFEERLRNREEAGMDDESLDRRTRAVLENLREIQHCPEIQTCKGIQDQGCSFP